MLRLLISGIWTTASTLLSLNQNPAVDQPSSTSKWRTFRNLFFSTISAFGIPLVRSMATNDTLYEYVNTFLGNSIPTRTNTDHHQRRNNSINRNSRPNFRRRSHHNGGIVRIVKPTFNIIIK
jgi:hypothetical protein